MARFATEIQFILVAIISLAACSSVHPADAANAVKKKSKPPAVAKSHDELAKLVFAAIDDEDYTAIQQLLAPVKLLEEIGTPKKTREAYAKYLERVAKLAKAYREFLDRQKLIPLRGRTSTKYKDDDLLAKEVNGKRLQYSTGIRVIENRGKDDELFFEIVDQAIGYDGRWYITHLVMESIEDKLKIPEGNDAPAEEH